ncbi:MAG: hypothetical protein GXY61_09750 [Lentisphaerae bacterium]|jgi:hypothetical protein|nr:hypothetical protein [Lentisphaerota bacterium]
MRKIAGRERLERPSRFGWKGVAHSSPAKADDLTKLRFVIGGEEEPLLAIFYQGL